MSSRYFGRVWDTDVRPPFERGEPGESVQKPMRTWSKPYGAKGHLQFWEDPYGSKGTGEGGEWTAEDQKKLDIENGFVTPTPTPLKPSTQKGSGGQMSKLSYITTPKGHVFEPRDLPSEIEGYYKGPFDSVSLPDSNKPEKHNLATLPVDDGEGDDWDDQLDYYIGLTDTSPYNERSTGKAVLPTGEGGVGLNETDRVLAKQNGPLKATKNKDGTWDFSRDYGEDSQWYDPKIDYDRRRAFLDAPDGQTGYKRALATQGVIRRGNMDFVQDEDGKEYAINSRDVMNGNKTVGAILDELTGVSTEGGVIEEVDKTPHPLQEPLKIEEVTPEILAQARKDDPSGFGVDPTTFENMLEASGRTKDEYNIPQYQPDGSRTPGANAESYVFDVPLTGELTPEILTQAQIDALPDLDEPLWESNQSY